MTWRAKDNFHNSREYAADEPAGGGLWGTIRKLFGRMLQVGGEPTAEVILFTHGLDDRIAGIDARARRRAPGAGQPNPWTER
jgi:hypothetical protein